MRLPSNYFPEGVLNPIPRNTHSFGGFPSLSDKGSSGLMGLNALRNASGVATSWLLSSCGVFLHAAFKSARVWTSIATSTSE